MSAVLKLAEQMVKLDRLIKTTRDSKLREIMRDEYKRLTDQVQAAAATQTKVENRKCESQSSSGDTTRSSPL